MNLRHARCWRHLKSGTRGGLLIDRKRKVRVAERKDSKFVIHGSDNRQSGKDMAVGYTQLQRLEWTWRRLRSHEPLVWNPRISRELNVPGRGCADFCRP